MWSKSARGLVLALSILAFNVEVHADTLPQGCFVSDAARIVWNYPPCFNEARNNYFSVTPLGGYSAEQIYSYYGYQYGFEVVASSGFYTNWQNSESSANQNKQAADIHYGWYVEQFEKNKKLNSLEAKLRKACGSKCKNIKKAKSVLSRTSDSSPQPALMTKDASPDRGVSYEEYRARLASKPRPQN